MAASLLSLNAPPSTLPAAPVAEWRSLLKENDPELRAEGFLHLAGRLERRGEPAATEAAVGLYHSLAASPDLSAAAARRAAERLEVLAGGGSFGARSERGLGMFFQQASDPALLLGMGVASGVFQAVRFGVLARLAASPSAGHFTRGPGARLLAGGIGLAVEAPAFTAATRAGHAALGRPLDWSSGALGRELASGYLMLGVLKAAGGAVSSLAPRVATPNQAFLHRIYSQSAMLGGLMLVHRAEESLGWRPASGFNGNLADSLATLAQLAVAGRVSRSLLGEGYARALRETELRVGPLAQTSRPLFLSPALAPAGAALPGPGLPARPSAESELRSNLVFAVNGKGNGNGNGESLIGRRLNQLIEPELGKAADSFQPPQGRIRKNVGSIGILTSGGDGPAENAAISALVHGAIQAHGWRVFGIVDGYRGLLEPQGRIRELKISDVQGHSAIAGALRLLYGENVPVPLENIYGGESDISMLGGTILRSSRTNPVHGDPDASQVQQTMRQHGIDALVVLGGNGSMRAAAELHRAKVPVVGIPQSIDGDVWGSEHSLGFPSAVAKGVSLVHNYLTTAHASRRWFLVEVMGQRYGLLTLAIADRSRIADAAFTEVPRPFDDLRRIIESRRPERLHGVILISEGVKFRGHGPSLIEPPRGADGHGRLINEPGDVAHWVRRVLADRQIETQTRSESLGYLLRGADTSYADKVLADHLSLGALRLVASGRFGHMAGTAFIEGGSALKLHSVPLIEVARNEKDTPHDYYDHVRQHLEGH
ncbi:MAG TPA: 6-phosphofructokinase [bacterium]|nr:6-phosphofructokinase [bacterium]